MSKIKKLFFNYTLLVLLITIGGINGAIAQNIKVEDRLQEFSIKLGDQTKLFLVVEQGAKDQVSFPRLADTIPGKIQIVTANKPDTTVDKSDKNKITVIQSYLITSFDAGTHLIPAFEFGTASGVLKTNELTLQVQPVKVDTTKAIYDIKQPMAVTYGLVDWLRDNWVWVAIVLVVLLTAAGFAYYAMRKPTGDPGFRFVKPAVPVDIVALKKLDELKAKNLWQQDEIKQYHSELTDIVREYLEQRYSVKTYEKTTDEILEALTQRDIPADQRLKLQEILVTADLVKFAKGRPLPKENEDSLEYAVTFVQTTKAVNNPNINADNTEGGSVNESV